MLVFLERSTGVKWFVRFYDGWTRLESCQGSKADLICEGVNVTDVTAKSFKWSCDAPEDTKVLQLQRARFVVLEGGMVAKKGLRAAS